MAFSSFSIAQFSLDEATDQFERFYQVGQEQMDTFKRCCDAFDYLINSVENEEVEFEVKVDDDDKTVQVLLTLPNQIFSKGTPPEFGWIVDWALSMVTGYTNDGRVRINFVFPSLWEEIL